MEEVAIVTGASSGIGFSTAVALVKAGHRMVIEPGPARTAFFTNMGGNVGAPAGDDPYAAMLARCDATIAGLAKDGETTEGVAAVVLAAVTSDSPRLRYPSSPAASMMAGRKIVDVTGNSIVKGTRELLG